MSVFRNEQAWTKVPKGRNFHTRRPLTCGERDAAGNCLKRSSYMPNFVPVYSRSTGTTSPARTKLDAINMLPSCQRIHHGLTVSIMDKYFK
ncbi:MAG: hypothetical protein LBH60_01250 [Prevotellaceae bacterium]|nr:hypothetical protein [Prevotellaceae bacterium]